MRDANRSTPRAIFVPQNLAIGVAIDQLVLVMQVAENNELDFPGGMMFIPL